MNMSAQCRHGAELDLVAVDQDQAAVMGQRAVGDDQVRAEDLPPPGSPPISMLRSARLT